MSVLQISTWVLQERTALDIYLRSPGADCTRYLPEFSRSGLHQISTSVLQERTVPDIYLSFPGTDCTRYLPEFSRNWLHQISTRSKRNYCKPCSQYFQFLRRYQNILSWYLLKQFVIILFKVLLQSPDTELQVQFTTATFESLTD